MGLDIRYPIGFMFSVIGLIVAVYGMITQFTNPEMYARTQYANVNLWWGMVLTAFGATMLVLAFRSKGITPSNTDNAFSDRKSSDAPRGH